MKWWEKKVVKKKSVVVCTRSVVAKYDYITMLLREPRNPHSIRPINDWIDYDEFDDTSFEILCDLFPLSCYGCPLRGGDCTRIYNRWLITFDETVSYLNDIMSFKDETTLGVNDYVKAQQNMCSE
jgi:hypothetical protein